MSKNWILASRPAEQMSKLFTGENAIPEHALECAANLNLNADVFLGSAPALRFAYKSQTHTTPDSYDDAIIWRFVVLNFTIVSADF
jgi:hypothetical protein